MAMGVLIDADRPGEEVRQRLPLTLWSVHIGKRSFLDIEGVTHERDPKHIGTESAGLPGGDFELFERLKYGRIIFPT